MTHIITKLSHPLDAVWSAAIEALHDAHCAMDALPEDFTDEQLEEAGEEVSRHLMTLMALPARNVADSLYKLSVAGIEDSPRTDCDITAIMNEATTLLDAGIARGRKQAEQAS